MNMCRSGKLVDCFQLGLPQKSYTEPKDVVASPFPFITMLSLSYEAIHLFDQASC